MGVSKKEEKTGDLIGKDGRRRKFRLKRGRKSRKNLTMKKREFYSESGRAGDSAQKREYPSKSGRLGTYVTHRNNYLSTPEYTGINFAKIKPMAIINNY